MERLLDMPEIKTEMGTVEWGRRQGEFSKGRLTSSEKARLIFNLGRMFTLQVADSLKSRLGLMNAYGTELEGLQPPDTALVSDALEFADDVQNLELMRHSWRTYYWALLLGGYRGLSVDKEILFAAAILHDVGLAAGRSVEPGQCCFVVSGAERCRHHLVGKGHDRAKVRKISNAIGLHLNGHVSARLHGVEAHLLSRGAMCDVFGMGRARISKTVRDRVLADYPRGDLVNALEIWPDHHLPGTRADTLIRLERRRKTTSSQKPVSQPAE